MTTTRPIFPGRRVPDTALIFDTETPVVYVNFLSMYPTVCSLMELWRLLTAPGLRVDDTATATRQVRKLLDDYPVNRWRG